MALPLRLPTPIAERRGAKPVIHAIEVVALVAGAAPADLRGTAFGVFNLVSGVALLAASVIAGGLWTWAGPAMTFYAGAAFSLVALAGLVAPRRAG